MKGMIEIIRKSFFNFKKLAFLSSFVILCHGFCFIAQAGETNKNTAGSDSGYMEAVAGNAGILNRGKVSRVVANNALRFTPDGAMSLICDLIGADKLENNIESASDLSKTSIPKTDTEEKVNSLNNKTVLCTYSDAIGKFKSNNTNLLDDETTSDSAIAADKTNTDTKDILTSGSSAEVAADNTNSETTKAQEDTTGEVTTYDEETQITTEEGKSSKRGSFGGGKSSRKAERSDNSEKDSSPDKSAEESASDKPGAENTDTPDIPKKESNDDNENLKEIEPDSDDDDNKNEADELSGESDDSSVTEGIFEPSDNDGNDGSAADKPLDDNLPPSPEDMPISGTDLPQTGSPVDTLAVTLCGLALVAFGAIFINKK